MYLFSDEPCSSCIWIEFDFKILYKFYKIRFISKRDDTLKS